MLRAAESQTNFVDIKCAGPGVRLCRPIALSPQVTSPQPKLRRPNIGVVSPQHQSCVAQTRNFAYQVKVCKILRSIYANDRLIT